MSSAKRKNSSFQYQFKRSLQIQNLETLDVDFLEYDLYDIPYYKISKQYYFGGVKRNIRVPLSMPHRVIIESNPPRQGYSSLTWNTLNAYYLQRSMNVKQYTDILEKCRSICYQSHSVNREEDQFGKESKIQSMNKTVWICCILTLLILMFTETASLQSKHSDLMFIICESLFGLSLILIIALSIYNFRLKPPNKIFITYESFLREELEKYFKSLNQGLDDKLQFEISYNPNNALWIEIQILDKSLQMPYSDYEIQKHMNYLQQKQEENFETESDLLVQYVMQHSNEKLCYDSLSIVSIKSDQVNQQNTLKPPPSPGQKKLTSSISQNSPDIFAGKPPLSQNKFQNKSLKAEIKDSKSNKTFDAKTNYDSARTGGSSYRESSEQAKLIGHTGSLKIQSNNNENFSDLKMKIIPGEPHRDFGILQSGKKQQSSIRQQNIQRSISMARKQTMKNR